MTATFDTAAYVDTFDGWWCTECESLCHPYEQGLCCNCGEPWETERLDEEQYPKKWIKVMVEVRKAGE